MPALPNQKLSRAKSELQRETVGVYSSYKSVGQPPYNEACKYAYLWILIREASTNKKYEQIMHIEARKTIFLKLLQYGK